MQIASPKAEEVRVDGRIGLTAQWDETKYDQKDLKAPDGAIICQAIITQISRTSASYNWKQIDGNTVRIWMRAQGSGHALDRWRGWVDLSYELICLKPIPDPEATVTNEIECPKNDDPDEGGTGPVPTGGGVETFCMVPPEDEIGTLMCMPYEIIEGKQVFGTPFPCGVCYKNSWG